MVIGAGEILIFGFGFFAGIAAAVIACAMADNVPVRSRRRLHDPDMIGGFAPTPDPQRAGKVGSIPKPIQGKPR